MPTLNPCLWFDSDAEEAATFYTGIFKNSRIKSVSRYGDAGKDIHKKPVGSAMAVEFEIDGQTFTALNGGPVYRFNEAISFQIPCKSQEEIDYYWDKLSEGGDPKAQQCGWLKDKFGLSWQVVPTALAGLMSGPNGQKVAQAMFQMKKFDIAVLTRAAEG